MTQPAEIFVADHEMTFEEFLTWAETVAKEAGRFELWAGRVISKRGPAGSINAERSQHSEFKFELAMAFRMAILAAGIEAQVGIERPTARLPSGRGVEPDVLVYLGPKAPRNTLVVPDPVIVCEVLSPSTAKHDMSAKLEGHFELPSVQHYIAADPDRPMLIVHSRVSETTFTTRLVSDAGEPLRLDPPGLSLGLFEILAG